MTYSRMISGSLFFFNARGTLLEKSLEGMYRTLLYQLLVQCPGLEKAFQKRPWNHMTWPVELLEDHLRDCVLQLGARKLTSHIDALDECEESDVRGPVEFFEDLGSMAVSAGVQMHVCFASRHYPHISISRCVDLVLDNLKGHRDDICVYVWKNLKVPEPTLRNRLAKEITARAHEVFLWVVLVVRVLNKENDRGNGHNLRAQLDVLPSSLHDLFDNAIVERGADDSQYLMPTLLWILFSARRLSLWELYDAIMCTRSSTSDAAVVDRGPDFCQIEKFVLNTSKGLAEITPCNPYPLVQFIHETVRGYLLSSGIGRLESSFCNNPIGNSHDFLKMRCVEYVSLAAPIIQRRKELLSCDSNDNEGFEDYVHQTFPFARHALAGLVTHAESAQAHGISQVSFLEAFPRDAWIKLASLIRREVGVVYYPSTTTTYILALCSAPLLLQEELNRAEDGSKRRSRMDKGAIVPVRLRPTLRPFQGLSGTPLQAAIITGSSRNVKILLEHGSDANATIGERYGTVLGLADQSGWDLEIVGLLLQHGADVNARQGDGLTVLQSAAGQGNLGAVRLLLERGAEVDTEGELFGTALQAASGTGGLEIVRCLVEHGADVNARGGKFRVGTAPQIARRHEYQEMIGYLLEHGARDDDNETEVATSRTIHDVPANSEEQLLESLPTSAKSMLTRVRVEQRDTLLRRIREWREYKALQ
jgi:hypothetical protein